MKNFHVSQFSNFFLVGIDHRTAGVEVREKFTFSEEKAAHLIYDYKQLGGDGIMILSTCNRTEIYGFGNCPRDMISLFCKHTGSDREIFYQHQNIKQNREAIEHLFKVGSGLESKILGDFEIIGQIKKAFQFTKDLDAHNPFLERLVNSAIQCSKRVKNETELSTGAASVAFAAVLHVKEFIKKSGEAEPKVLLVGTGKIGRTACENLVNQTGLKDITLINRTHEKAERLADRFGVKHLDYAHLDGALNSADVVIVATGASTPTILPGHFKTQKPRLLLDLSMPRNIAPELYHSENFKVIDVDDLASITEESKQRRQGQVPLAMVIIHAVIDDFYAWLETRRVAPTLQAVRQKMESWKSKEVQNLLKKCPELNEEHADILADQLLNRITGQFARRLKSGEDVSGDLRTIHHVFELEAEKVLEKS